MSRLGGYVSDLGYRAGWAGVRLLPDSWGRTVFEGAGAMVGRLLLAKRQVEQLLLGFRSAHQVAEGDVSLLVVLVNGLMQGEHRPSVGQRHLCGGTGKVGLQLVQPIFEIRAA